MPPEPRAMFTRSEVFQRIDALVYRIVIRTLERAGVTLAPGARQALIRELSRQERQAFDQELGWTGEETDINEFEGK